MRGRIPFYGFPNAFFLGGLVERLENRFESFYVARVGERSGSRSGNERHEFGIYDGSDGFSIRSEKIRFLPGRLVGNEEVDALGVSDTDGMDLDFPFGHELRNGFGIDSHVRFAVGHEHDVLVSGRAGKAFGREQESFSDVRSRQSRDFLVDGIGGDFRKNGGERFGIARKRTEEKRFSCENHESKPVAVPFRDEVRENAFGCLDAVGREVFREHRF